jgi:hypothetical protein
MSFGKESLSLTRKIHRLRFAASQDDIGGALKEVKNLLNNTAQLIIKALTVCLGLMT